MRKKTVGVLVVALVLILTIIGCIPKTIPPLRGAYQSEHVNGYSHFNLEIIVLLNTLIIEK